MVSLDEVVVGALDLRGVGVSRDGQYLERVKLCVLAQEARGESHGRLGCGMCSGYDKGTDERLCEGTR